MPFENNCITLSCEIASLSSKWNCMSHAVSMHKIQLFTYLHFVVYVQIVIWQ